MKPCITGEISTVFQKNETLRLRANDRTMAPPPPYKYIGEAPSKKFLLIWLRCETSWGWADQEFLFTCTTPFGKKMSWRPTEDVGQNTQKKTSNLSLDRESLAAHNGERTGWKVQSRSRKAWSASIRDVFSSICYVVQPIPCECSHKYKAISCDRSTCTVNWNLLPISFVA